MTALPANIVTYQGPAASLGPLLPQTISEAMQLARLMSEARLVPDHLRGSPADCYLVVNQARLWRMDPFAVAQGTSFIHGKMMYEGKLIAGVVHSLGNLTGRLNYEYEGAGPNRSVTVSGTLRGETKPRTVVVRLADAKTKNDQWVKQPDQQLAYHGARVWARRHVPEVLLGVYAPEEFDAPQMRDVTPVAPQIEQTAAAPPPKPAARPIRVKVPGEPDALFAQDQSLEAALGFALAFMSDAILDNRRDVVEANAALLDRIAERLPEMSDAVAELRAAAVMAEGMADAAELADDSTEDFPGDFPPAPSSSPSPHD